MHPFLNPSKLYISTRNFGVVILSQLESRIRYTKKLIEMVHAKTKYLQPKSANKPSAISSAFTVPLPSYLSVISREENRAFWRT